MKTQTNNAATGSSKTMTKSQTKTMLLIARRTDAEYAKFSSYAFQGWALNAYMDGRSLRSLIAKGYIIERGREFVGYRLTDEGRMACGHSRIAKANAIALALTRKTVRVWAPDA